MSSLSSSTGSGSLTSSSSVSTLFSQTFTTSSPTPTSPGPTFTDGNGNPNGSIASSASLYLYTFLATLVLLLSVSGAIILRSLILRRRHRMMVEEAIRNGTWIPPAPRGAGSFRLGRNTVDLSKKPQMWQAFVADSEKHTSARSLPHRSPHDHDENQTQHYAVTEGDWDTLRPFSASYLPPHAPLPLPPQHAPLPLPGAGTVGFPPRLSYYRRLIRFLRPSLESSAPYPLNERRASQVNIDASSPVDWTGNPRKLQVAVIVAMPRPPTEHHHHHHSASSSSSPPSLASDDEPEIPLIEFGVALLDVKGDADGPASAAHAEKNNRASASRSGSMEV